MKIINNLNNFQDKKYLIIIATKDLLRRPDILQYRNNLFSVRFINDDGILPISRIEVNDNTLINNLKNTSDNYKDEDKNLLYLGIVTKNIKEYKNYGNKIYYFIFYSKKSGLIMLKNDKLLSVSNTLDMSNETYTFMELS